MSLKHGYKQSRLGEKNKAGEREFRNVPHASRHALHIVVARRSCILECLWNTIVNEVASEKK
jgi:hypothetical protein